MKTIEALERLEKVLQKSPLPRAKREWGGADVVITRKDPPIQQESGFYPEPRYVVTTFSLELSWLFEGLRDSFYIEGKIDSCSKIELFGRLANAANRCILNTPELTANLLCAAVLHEAFAIHEEIEEGNFRFLELAIGNEIVDDYVDEAIRTGYIGTEATLDFFRSHGVEVENV